MWPMWPIMVSHCRDYNNGLNKEKEEKVKEKKAKECKRNLIKLWLRKKKKNLPLQLSYYLCQ